MACRPSTKRSRRSIISDRSRLSWLYSARPTRTNCANSLIAAQASTQASRAAQWVDQCRSQDPRPANTQALTPSRAPSACAQRQDKAVISDKKEEAKSFLLKTEN